MVQGVASHPEDGLVLATAVSAKADYLVTGDSQLQRLGQFEGEAIVPPRTFLDYLISRVDSSNHEEGHIA
jgi:predicted nucleic acid-binding protein